MTYATLAVPFVAAAALLLLAAAVLRRPGRDWWRATAITLVALVLTTIVFDNVMIAAGLFHYDDARLAGPHVGRAPVEDLAWPVAAALGLPALALLVVPGKDTA